MTTRTRCASAVPLPPRKHACRAAKRLAPDDRRAFDHRSRARPCRRSPRFAHAWPVALLVAWCAGAFGTSDHEARDDLERVRERLAAVAAELAEAYDDRDSLTRALARSEKRAAGIQREIERLDDRLAAARKRSDAAHGAHSRLIADLAEDRERLARSVRASYRFARRDPVAMLLDLETPRKIDRMLAYHRLIEGTHVERIRRVTHTVARLKALETEVNDEAAAITALREKKRLRRAELEEQRSARADAMHALAGRIRDRESLAQRLRADEQRLVELVEALRASLSDAALEPHDSRLFGELRGRLPWPVRGVVRAAREAHDNGNGTGRRGVYIRAAAGQPVRSIHRGRIAYADWLRGFGLLLIIEHGDGFMSLYGHNETLTRETGDWVEPGETIATVGDSGGYSEPALYFEIRRDGSPVNPRKWCVDPTAAVLVSP